MERHWCDFQANRRQLVEQSGWVLGKWMDEQHLQRRPNHVRDHALSQQAAAEAGVGLAEQKILVALPGGSPEQEKQVEQTKVLLQSQEGKCVLGVWLVKAVKE